MVLGDDPARFFREAKLAPDVDAVVDMQPVQGQLGPVELLVSFFQHTVGNLDFPNVVKHGGRAEFARRIGREAELPGQHHGQNGDVQAVVINIFGTGHFSHRMQGGVTALQKSPDHLPDEFAHFGQRFLGAGEEITVQVPHHIACFDESLFYLKLFFALLFQCLDAFLLKKHRR